MCKRRAGRFRQADGWRSVLPLRRQGEVIMSVPMSLLLGIVVGIVLFFVLERTGVVYKWFDKWDKH